MDDVVTIELRAPSPARRFPFVDKTFKPDAAIADVSDGVELAAGLKFLSGFPYLGTPYSGYDTAA
jgi:hypothetical protein